MESKGVWTSSFMAKTWKLSDIDVLSASEALDKGSATYICAPGLYLTSTVERCNRNIILCKRHGAELAFDLIQLLSSSGQQGIY